MLARPMIKVMIASRKNVVWGHRSFIVDTTKPALPLAVVLKVSVRLSLAASAVLITPLKYVVHRMMLPMLANHKICAQQVDVPSQGTA